MKRWFLLLLIYIYFVFYDVMVVKIKLRKFVLNNSLFLFFVDLNLFLVIFCLFEIVR